jgi:hypothetical protein
MEEGKQTQTTAASQAHTSAGRKNTGKKDNKTAKKHSSKKDNKAAKKRSGKKQSASSTRNPMLDMDPED